MASIMIFTRMRKKLKLVLLMWYFFQKCLNFIAFLMHKLSLKLIVRLHTSMIDKWEMLLKKKIDLFQIYVE